MPQMSLAFAESLGSAQAAELLTVLELQATWEETKTLSSEADGYTVKDLHRRQRTYDDYFGPLSAYYAHYQTTRIPELSPTSVDRLRTWCETVQVILRRAETPIHPIQTVARAYRAAERIAVRTQRTAPEHQANNDVNAAIQSLAAIIEWCNVKEAIAVKCESAESH